MPASAARAPDDRTSREERRWLVIWTVLLALASFAASVVLGRDLFATGVQREWNILFDADPNVYLKNFSTGGTIGDWGGRSFVHPNLTNFVYPPVRVLAEILARLNLGSSMEVREALAFLVSPLFATLRVPLLVMLMRSLGLSVGWALTIAALDTVSFSTRLFSSIPESYLPTGTLLVFVFWLAARDVRSDRKPSLVTWGGALYFLFGVSMLNLAAGTVLLGLTLMRHYNRVRALSLTAAVVLAAFGLNAAVYEASRLVYPNAPKFHPMGTEHLDDSWNPGPARFLDYPVALANAYFPPRPRVTEYYDISNTREYAFTFERTGPGAAFPDPRTIVFLGLLVLSIASYRWLPGPNRSLFWSAWLILTFGTTLHSFFGKELVLYTQHWKAPVIVLLAGLYYLPARAHRLLSIGLPWFVGAVALNNTVFLHEIVGTLARR